MSVEFDDLTPEDRTAILAEADRIRAIPPGVNTTSPGCAMLILAVVLFLAVPAGLRHLSPGVVSRVLAYCFIALEIFLVLLGVYWSLRSSGGAYARAALTAKEAIEAIKSSFAEGNGLECGKAAARLVAGAYYSDGPGMTTTFDFGAARQQIGPALPFVISVEKFLIWKSKADKVFTLSDSSTGSESWSIPRS